MTVIPLAARLARCVSLYNHILKCLWPFWLVFFAAGENPAHEVVSSALAEDIGTVVSYLRPALIFFACSRMVFLVRSSSPLRAMALARSHRCS